MAGDLLLGVHAVAGALGLLLGPIGYLGRRGEHARALGDAYLAAIVCVAATALGLVASDPAGLWWLAPLALFTVALASLCRSTACSRAGAGWGGSYIALVTAALVVSFPSVVLFWFLPTLVGVVAIHWPGHARLPARGVG